MGFLPSRADPSIWMRRVDDHYEYIATYVDDLAIASKKPQEIIDALMNKYKFKLKGTGEISFHLGCDYFRDQDGVLRFAPKQYIEKMVSSFERMFGTKLKTNVSSPLEKGDHPEIDDSEFLEQSDIQKYQQSLIGQLQWAISLGRFDISTAIMHDTVRFPSCTTKGSSRTCETCMWIPIKDEACYYTGEDRRARFFGNTKDKA
eukprot:scaffold8446_cov90-Cylindrotheca_fusiformis.AAC.2